MSTKMVDGLTVNRNKIYKGAGRLVVSDPETLTSFPGALESVINPASPADGGDPYALADGWSDAGPTTDDGYTLTRSMEESDGITVDQRGYVLDEGEPEGWEMGLETTLLDTSLESIKRVWKGGAIRTITASGSNVAQQALDLDAPTSLTERMAAVVQEDPKTGKLRVAVFRKTVAVIDSEINMQRTEASELPFELRLKADPNISEGSGEFGRIYEES